MITFLNSLYENFFFYLSLGDFIIHVGMLACCGLLRSRWERNTKFAWSCGIRKYIPFLSCWIILRDTYIGIWSPFKLVLSAVPRSSALKIPSLHRHKDIYIWCFGYLLLEKRFYILYIIFCLSTNGRAPFQHYHQCLTYTFRDLANILLIYSNCRHSMSSSGIVFHYGKHLKIFISDVHGFWLWGTIVGSKAYIK